MSSIINCLAVSLAMARDGSSGGVIRLVNITKDKEQREFVSYNQLTNKM
jgi:20S proteasome subunit beta 1